MDIWKSIVNQIAGYSPTKLTLREKFKLWLARKI
jgi:hypothetical protein